MMNTPGLSLGAVAAPPPQAEASNASTAPSPTRNASLNRRGAFAHRTTSGRPTSSRRDDYRVWKEMWNPALCISAAIASAFLIGTAGMTTSHLPLLRAMSM